MTSQFAREDLEDLRAEGLNSSDEDVIRLHALALRITAGPATTAWNAPRFAAVGVVVFWEPAMAVREWYAYAKTFAADVGTEDAMFAFACARGRERGYFTIHGRGPTSIPRGSMPRRRKMTRTTTMKATNTAHPASASPHDFGPSAGPAGVRAERYPSLKSSQNFPMARIVPQSTEAWQMAEKNIKGHLAASSDLAAIRAANTELAKLAMFVERANDATRQGALASAREWATLGDALDEAGGRAVITAKQIEEALSKAMSGVSAKPEFCPGLSPFFIEGRESP